MASQDLVPQGAFDVDELGVDANEGAGLDGGDHAAARSTLHASVRPLQISGFLAHRVR
jgi:hypothetical protein